ncbi:MAG: sulfatase-like hydrolase/transferase [Gaiellaceae bacterium]
MPPNVLVVILDAARRDALEPYGAPAGSSPAIAQLARRGRAHDDVYATGCWTVPSHASIFTGLMPRAAGLARVPSPAAAKPALEAHRDRLLPEVMRRAGYSTAAASANLWLCGASGFATGFDDFEEIDTDRNAQINLTSRKEHLRWLAEAAVSRADDGARAVESAMAQWLADSSRRPFFWFVNLLECHSPYLPPRPYGARSPLERLRAAEDARRHYTLEGIWRACTGIATVPDATLERMRRLYAASVRYMDDWLSRVLERLDTAGVLDETLVVVTSDHGENLGEGGLIGHALSLDQRLINVPLVMAGPGADASVGSLAELPRVVAEAAAVENHPWTDGPPRGVGVAQFDPPFDVGDPEAVERLRKAGLEEAHEGLTTPLTCAVAGGLKLLRRGDTELVYDLDADPLELDPKPPQHFEAAGRANELRALRAALEHPAVTARSADDAASAPPEAETSDEEREDLERRMRLLGYM